MVAWGETLVKGSSDKGSGYHRGGDLVAGLPAELQTAQERLVQTQDTIERTLGLSSPKNFASRFKNFDS